MSAEGRRGKRVAELIRMHLSAALSRELGDPKLSSLVLTSVEVTDDLQSARIGVRLLIGDQDPKERKAAMTRLERASGRLRRLVAPRLELRRAPELRFHYDAGHDASRRVEEILHEIEVENESQKKKQP